MSQNLQLVLIAVLGAVDEPPVTGLKLENYYFFTFFFFSTWSWKIIPYFDGLVQDCSQSSELAIELLQPCTKPSIYFFRLFFRIYFLAFLYLRFENYSILILLLTLSVSLPEPINQPPTS